MNFDNLKNLISTHEGWEVDTVASTEGSLLIGLTLASGLEAVASLSVRPNGIVSDVEVREWDEETCEETILVEGNQAFSLNDEALETTLFNWIKTQISYASEG